MSSFENNPAGKKLFEHPAQSTLIAKSDLQTHASHKSHLPRLHGMRINLGIVEIAYQGSGHFLYFYRKKGTLKSGALQIDKRAAIWLLVGVFLLTGSASLALWKKRSGTVQIAISNEKRGVGGVGRLESGKVINKASDIVGTMALNEDDEKVKDQLMGVVEEKQTSDNAAAKKLEYKVKPGETLKSIAKKYKVPPDAIATSSKMKEEAEVRAGQVLTIPTRSGFFYTVKKNERLANILQDHKVPLDKFIAENPTTNIDMLDMGEEIFLPGAKPIKSSDAWLIPVASRTITSGYGWRNWPKAAFHKGLDLKAFFVPVRSAKGGVVTFSGWLGGYGNAIVVTHDGTYKSLYAHLSRRYVSVGQKIPRGHVIGRTGDTGYSFGPHLHFEISKNGENINPSKMLRGLRRRR